MEMTKAAERKSSWALLVKLARPYRGMAVAALVLLLCDICGMLFIPTELSALMNAAIEGQERLSSSTMAQPCCLLRS